MAQRVRTDPESTAAAAYVARDEALHAPARQSPAARVDEERVSGLRSAVCGPDKSNSVPVPLPQAFLGCRIERDDALLASFAHDPDHAAGQVDVLEIERDQLAQTNARRIKELQDGAVSSAKRRRDVWSLQQLRHLVDG